MVKKEVKQVMEESVTKKYVHEESASVTSLCGAVEACLSQGINCYRGIFDYSCFSVSWLVWLNLGTLLFYEELS